MFPLDPFTVHSVPLLVLVNWFEEILDGQVIDETGLPGIYGFELRKRVNTPEAFIQLLYCWFRWIHNPETWHGRNEVAAGDH